MGEWRELAPYLAGLIIFLAGWVTMQRRSDALDADQGQWRQVADVERERVARLERRVNALLDHIFALNRLLSTSAPGTTIPLPPLVEDAPTTPLTRIERSVWRRLLVTRLSHDELCNAAFDLGLDVEGVTGKGEIARRLLDHLDDRGKMDLLRRWLEVNGRQDLLAEGENR
jgi:hypothetical protein